MSFRDDGGSAFPRLEQREVMRESGWGTEETQAPGVTVRDYFAAKAMQALIAGLLLNDMARLQTMKAARDRLIGDVISDLAYEHADAMLEARKK